MINDRACVGAVSGGTGRSEATVDWLAGSALSCTCMRMRVRLRKAQRFFCSEADSSTISIAHAVHGGPKPFTAWSPVTLKSPFHSEVVHASTLPGEQAVAELPIISWAGQVG